MWTTEGYFLKVPRALLCLLWMARQRQFYRIWSTPLSDDDQSFPRLMLLQIVKYLYPWAPAWPVWANPSWLNAMFSFAVILWTRCGKTFLAEPNRWIRAWKAFLYPSSAVACDFAICSASELFIAFISKQAFSLSEKSSFALSSADMKSLWKWFQSSGWPEKSGRSNCKLLLLDGLCVSIMCDITGGFAFFLIIRDSLRRAATSPSSLMKFSRISIISGSSWEAVKLTNDASLRCTLLLSFSNSPTDGSRISMSVWYSLSTFLDSK